MKKNYLLLLIAFLCAFVSGFGQVTTIDFETAGDGYTPSTTNGTDFTDVFNRANPNIGGNNTFLWAAEDLAVTDPYIDIDPINVTSATSFTFSIDMLTHHYNDWDDDDELLITYSLDGGTYQNLMWVQNAGATFNQAASLDTDFDGNGDCGLGILPAITTGNSGCNVTNNSFETFSTASISLSGNSTLDINLQFNGLDATDEGIYLDNIVIDVAGGTPTPNITATPTTITGLDYVFGTGPSASQSFDITGDLLVAGTSLTSNSTDFEISLTAVGGYGASVNVPAGTLNGTTTIYTRLVAGLAVNTYSNTITIANATPGIGTTPTITVSGEVTPAPPTNDTCLNATVLPVTIGASCTTASYTTINATNSGESTSCGGYTGSADIWFEITVPASGELNIETTAGALTDGVMAIYSGACGALTQIACDDDTNGSMPELNLTGLTPSETLYLLFWEYNGDNNGDFGICVWSPAPLSPCVAPTGQPSGLTLSNITGSSIDGSFTATTADDYLVVVSTSATLGANPVNNTTYTTGDSIGTGTVVQSSTATTFTATGLSQTTPYYFFVFALNDSSCGGGPIYNTTTPLTGDATTVTGPCLEESFESGLSTSGYQSGSWTLGSGTWSGTNIIRGTNVHTGSYSAQIRSATGANIISPELSSVQTVSFWAAGSTASSRVQVNYSTDGGTSWTAAPESPFNLTTSFSQYTATINTTSNTIVQFYRTEGTIYLDDVEIYCGSTCTPPADPTGTISGATPVCAASTSLSFSGTAPSDVAYYWQEDALGEDLTNDASSSLTVTTSGNYYVRAYNTVGGCWSDSVVGPYAVSVTTSAPIIDSQPSNISIGVGGTASFVVTSTNTSSYQWQVSTNAGATWTNIGTDSNSLAVSNVQLSDSGNIYQVILTNACGSTTSTTATLTVTTSTIFNPGDLIFVGYDGQIFGSGSEDEFLIATMVDITTGSEFSLVNSRYEAGAPANVRTNKWGGGSNTASEAPFETKITYTGSAIIPAGSVLLFRVTVSNTFIIFATVTEGTTTTTRTGDFNFNVVNPGLYANISTSGSDQLYLMQGDFVSDGTIDANEANYLFNGTLLHGITIDTPWIPITDACSGGSADANRVSRLPAELRCFNVESENDIRGYYENDKEHGLATTRTIVNNVSDYLGNWNLGSYSFDPTSTTAADGGRTFTISPSNPKGQWVGDVDTNWFNCANWEGLAVPTTTTDVTIDNSALNIASIDYTADYADEVNEIAYSNNLTISGSTLEIAGDINNILEVHGDLLIDAPNGNLDMDDSTPAADGYIKLYGDWMTNLGETAFDEGNSTVEFLGTTPQAIINGQTPIPPIIPEAFYNVILSNDFNTNASNNLYMNGSLLINPGNTLTVATNDYTYVNLGVTNNGTFNIENSGSLIQGDDAGVNTGNISMERTASLRRLDYVYWSSPVDGFNTNNISTGTPTNRIYSWDATVTNTNGSQGNWLDASGATMQEGVGYIVRGPSSFGTTAANYTATFNNGVPLNGIKTVPVSRGNDPVGFNTNDDDWNLVGNPYPSAIDAVAFLTLNTNIEGYINVWTHGTLPSSAIADPYYENFGANYDESDYLTYNSAGASTGPGTFNGSIAAAQSFMVNMVDGAATTETVTFNNSLRNLNLINSAFYRTATPEKNRIWLDLVPEGEAAKRILVGYIEDATMGVDRMFDAVTEIDSAKNFYSVLDNDAYKIQGRALPFVDTDIIPLGIEATTSGNYTLAIFAVDGLFETEGQTVYLKDNALGYTHNLTNAPYSFSLDAGTFNDRFEIVFNDTSLSINENEYNNAFTIIEQQDGTVKFSTSNGLQIKNVKVYDVLGRLLYNLNGNSSTETYNLDRLSQAAYLAKVTLSNDVVLTKKAIKRN